MKYTIPELDQEFTTVLNNGSDFRERQRMMVQYYNNNVFYAPSKGEPKPKRNVGVNMLNSFANKNIHYLSPFPTIKKSPSGTDMDSRMRASLIEKIVHCAWDKNGGQLLQRRIAVDGTLLAEPYLMVEWDIKGRYPTIRRLDPRFCHPVYANEVDNKLLAFYYAVPMTREAVMDKYNVDPTSSGIGSTASTLDGNEMPVDGVDRFWVVMRWDAGVRCVWVGDKFIEQPHKHLMGRIPVETARLFETGETNNRGGFFLEQLVPIQAEYNETLRKKANIIRKLANPAVWGRGIMASQFDDVKSALNGGGGFVGLKQQGELGLLQLQETKVLDQHLADLLQRMKDISGFPTATFGESIGANTSGDALSMYFQPTTQATANQWIAICNMYKNVNEMVLRCYETFGYTGETFKLQGIRSRGSFETIESTDDNGDKKYSQSYQGGGYGVEFTKDQIKKDYGTVIIPPSATPKDEYREKQLAQQASSTGFLPRVVAYEDYGIVDPEDTLQLLAEEREDPRLHPEVLQAAASALNQGAPAQGLPTGQPNQPVAPMGG